jgi:osmotically-inducible protein OsmY
MVTTFPNVLAPRLPQAPRLPEWGQLRGLTVPIDAARAWLDAQRGAWRDRRTRRRVAGAIGAARELDCFRRLRSIDVQAHDGVVRLVGHVGTPAQARLAEQIAWRVPGVAAVRNHLIDDESLEHQVAHALLQDPLARRACVRAMSWVGSLTLDGQVPSDEVRRRVVEVARSVPGVREVRDETTLTPHVPDPDAWWLER